MNASKLATATASVVLAIAACGGSGSGGGAPTGAPAATNAPGATTSVAGPTATAAGAATTPAASQDLAAVAAEMCGLLTPADLKTATGAVYGAGSPDAYGNCAWISNESGGSHVYAAILASTLADSSAMFPGGTQLTIGGHPAYWLPSGSLDTMYVDVNGRLLTLSFSPDAIGNQPIVTKLAEVAVGKM